MSLALSAVELAEAECVVVVVEFEVDFSGHMNLKDLGANLSDFVTVFGGAKLL